MKRAGKLGGPAEEIGGILEGNEAFQFWLFRQKWKEIVGDVLAEESIGRQEGDTIYICCTNSVWMQELMMNRAEILRRIQEDPFGKRFRNIRIQQGPRQRREAGKTTADGLEKYYGRDSRLRNAPTELDGGQCGESRTAPAHRGHDEKRSPSPAGGESRGMAFLRAVRLSLSERRPSLREMPH